MFARTFETVELLETRFNFFPALLRWRGEPVRVERVDSCRVERGGWLTPWRQLLRFRVGTPQGPFELVHEPRKNLWRIAAAEAPRADDGRWLLAAKPRYPLPVHKRRAFQSLVDALKGMRERRGPKTRRGKVRRYRPAQKIASS